MKFSQALKPSTVHVTLDPCWCRQDGNHFQTVALGDVERVS